MPQGPLGLQGITYPLFLSVLVFFGRQRGDNTWHFVAVQSFYALIFPCLFLPSVFHLMIISCVIWGINVHRQIWNLGIQP